MAAAGKVTVVLLVHNSAGMPPWRSVGMDRGDVEALLAHKHRVACPVAERLGYPLVLVPAGENPGGKLFHDLAYHGPDANQRATYAAITLGSGFAPGTAVGNAYAIRLDAAGAPVDFTAEDFIALNDFGLTCVLDLWGDGGPPSKGDYDELAQDIQEKRHSGVGAGRSGDEDDA